MQSKQKSPTRGFFVIPPLLIKKLYILQKNAEYLNLTNCYLPTGTYDLRGVQHIDIKSTIFTRQTLNTKLILQKVLFVLLFYCVYKVLPILHDIIKCLIQCLF